MFITNTLFTLERDARQKSGAGAQVSLRRQLLDPQVGGRHFAWTARALFTPSEHLSCEQTSVERFAL